MKKSQFVTFLGGGNSVKINVSTDENLYGEKSKSGLI